MFEKKEEGNEKERTEVEIEREGNGQEGRKEGRKRGWGKKQRTGEKSKQTH